MIRDQRQAGDAPRARGVPEHIIACRPPLPKHVTCQSLREPLAKQAQEGAPAAQFPIDPEVLSRLAKSRKLNMDASSTSFCEKAATIAVGESLQEKVEYPASCGCLCRSSNTFCSIRMHQDLLDILQKIVKGTGLKHVCVSQAAVLFAAEQYVAESEFVEAQQQVSFWALGAASGRQAHHPPQAQLGQLQVVSGSAEARRVVCM